MLTLHSCTTDYLKCTNVIFAFNRRGLLVPTIRRINHSSLACKNGLQDLAGHLLHKPLTAIRPNIPSVRYWAVGWGWAVGWSWAPGWGWSPAAQKDEPKPIQKKATYYITRVLQTPRYCPTHSLCCNQPRRCQQNKPTVVSKTEPQVTKSGSCILQMNI